MPPDDPDVTEMVTPEGTTFAAMAVVWLTDSVLLTIDGPVVTTVCDCGKNDAPAAAVPMPAAPPTRAAATMMPTTFPAPIWPEDCPGAEPWFPPSVWACGVDGPCAPGCPG